MWLATSLAGSTIKEVTRLGRLLDLALVFYFLEAGAFLLLSPWSRYWSERIVNRSPHSLQPFLLSPSFRGFLAGVGFLHIFFAVRELEMWRRSSARSGASSVNGRELGR